MGVCIVAVVPHCCRHCSPFAVVVIPVRRGCRCPHSLSLSSPFVVAVIPIQRRCRPHSTSLLSPFDIVVVVIPFFVVVVVVIPFAVIIIPICCCCCCPAVVVSLLLFPIRHCRHHPRSSLPSSPSSLVVSTHDSPHEQWLVRLGAGAVSSPFVLVCPLLAC